MERRDIWLKSEASSERSAARTRFAVALSGGMAVGGRELDEHTPVLVEEVLAALALRPDGLYVDATFGRGGHTARILEALGPEGESSPSIATRRRSRPGARALRTSRGCIWCTANSPICALVRAQTGSRTHCDGMLFDFGVSSPQLEDAARGFSFRKDGPLDMRMDPTRGEPVSAWLAHGALRVRFVT